MADVRPNPDALLARLQEQERKKDQGRLKLFLGMSAGVGKTYAMLAEGRQLLERGVDVVVGLAVTHDRKETEALIHGLPAIPQRSLEYRGVALKEFDLDATLLRKPEIVILDELAHTNAPGSRHPKRWQDIEELLESGISVYSAINIQHLESLNDVVAQISGTQVREMVPDAVINRADEIELIDISPEELRQRVREGKVYVPEQIDQALDGFFKTGTLIALRELALRRTADQVDAQMQHFREGEGVSGLWATRERILVCVAPNRLCERVVRAAARMGATSKAHLTALYVESSRQRRRTEEMRSQAEDALRRAEDQGMEIARRTGHDIVEEILRFAKSRNITLIIVGKPIKPKWKELAYGSVVDELVRRSGEIGVYVISGDCETDSVPFRPVKATRFPLKDYGIAAGFTVAATLISTLIFQVLPHLPHENIVMIYILGIAFCAARTRIRPALLCSVASVAAYDFFFVSPRFQFSVSDAAYLPTFAIMLSVGLLIGSLTSRLKHESEESSARERRTSALYDATREMARNRGRSNIAEAASRRLSDDLEVDVAVFLPNERSRLSVEARSRSHFENDHREVPVAHWVFDNGKPAGSTTDTLPSAKALYLPLKTGETIVGVIGVRSQVEDEQLDQNQIALMKTFATGLALALERANLARESAAARLSVEAERMRSSLLSSVSHDIRSPLTAIAGAASSLLEKRGDPDDLAETIYRESERLNRHVRDLLDMTRLDGGSVQPNLDWNSVEEMVGSALARTAWQLEGRKTSAVVSDQIPLMRFDGLLVEQAIVNLLENAVKHTPAGTPIEVVGRMDGETCRLSVVDHGSGIPLEEADKIFEKFYRQGADKTGFGLGLAITKAIMKVHGGDATVEPTPGGGATFVLSFPAGGTPPEAPHE